MGFPDVGFPCITLASSPPIPLLPSAGLWSAAARLWCPPARLWGTLRRAAALWHAAPLRLPPWLRRPAAVRLPAPRLRRASHGGVPAMQSRLIRVAALPIPLPHPPCNAPGADVQARMAVPCGDGVLCGNSS